MARYVVLAFVLLSATACRVQVIAPEKSAVITPDGSFICMAGERCEINVDSFDIDLTLYAVPEPGYAFVKWRDEEGYLCAGSTERGCAINTTTLDTGNPVVQDVLASDSVVYLEPVVEPSDEMSGYIWMHEGWPDEPPPEGGL